MKVEEFEITEEKTPEGVKFLIKGRLNAANADELQQKLQTAMDNGLKSIVLNMLFVDFLSSAGIRVIIKYYQDIYNAGGIFGIEMPSENVRNVLGMTALDDMLIKKPCAQ